MRDYLGSRRTARNINRQIERTVQEEPQNFWVYNNGITILTKGIKVQGRLINLSGCAVINGAQTTGSLAQAAIRGTVGAAEVLVRAVTCNDPALVDSVIRFNNTQNPIKAWELRVIDPIQRRLREDFDSLGVTYQLRRGSGRRRPGDVSYEKLGPYMSAFYGDPIAAAKNKAELFENESRYRRLFDENSNVRNLLFIYRLGNAVTRSKMRLKEKVGSSLASEDEKTRYQYFRYAGFPFALIHVCAEVLGFLLEATDQEFRRLVTLKQSILLDADGAEEHLSRFVEVVLPPVCMHLEGRDAYRELKTQSGVESIASHTKAIVEQVHQMKPDTYVELTNEVEILGQAQS